MIAVKNNLEALKKHFQTKFILIKEAGKKESMKFILENLRCEKFVKNLSTICAALVEMTVLSTQLQKKNLNLTDAHQIILNAVDVLTKKSEMSAEESDDEIIDPKNFSWS